MVMSCKGHVRVHREKQSVLSSSNTRDSALKKKSGSLAYDLVRERSAMEHWRTAHINSRDAQACLLAKFANVGEKKLRCFRKALTHIYGFP